KTGWFHIMNSSQTTNKSLPEVDEVRQRIESCNDVEIRMFLKCAYLFGARAVELCGRRCSGEKDLVYGPKGTDCWTDKTEAPDIPAKETLRIIIKAMSEPKQALKDIEERTKDVPVALFRISIAKQKLDEGEPAPHRIVALPLVDEYEPWAREVYEYFKSKGDDYVFPFNRAYVWGYLTHKQKLFKGLTYRIKKYNYIQVGEPVFKVLSHPRALKIHGLRHIRTDELVARFGFDGIDMMAIIGWKQGKDAPAMVGVYAEIREAWYRYIKKLCKVTT
ncbi:MAG: hypothetical protein NWF06_01895, partial [Candidatus Bathyarchaeota archaeon]|nr:hypothetical protein [Candidatus Bathyarchaeum sp.]